MKQLDISSMVDDFYSLPPKYRTKKQLKQAIEQYCQERIVEELQRLLHPDLWVRDSRAKQTVVDRIHELSLKSKGEQ